MTSINSVVVAGIVMLILIQRPASVHCQCDPNYPNPAQLSIDGNVEVADNLLSLVDGLTIQRFLLVCIY